MLTKKYVSAFFSLSLILGANMCFAQQNVQKASLLAVYYDAVLQNADLVAARADFAAKRETVPQAKAGLLPTVSVGASADKTRLTIKQSQQSVQNRSGKRFQANLTQPLFRLDRLFQVQAAQAMRMQAELEYTEREQLLILQAAENYIDTLRASDNLAALRAEEHAFERQLSQMQGRLKGGIATITDILDAQAAYDIAQANRQLAERQVADAFEQLTRLTHRHYRGIAGISHSLPILPPSPAQPQKWEDAALQQNLRLLAGHFNVKTSREIQKQQQAGHAPTVDFVANYRYGDNDSMGYSNTTQWTNYRNAANSSVGIQVNVPIYSGGLVNSKVRESHYRVIQSEAMYEAERQEVTMKTRNYYRALTSDIAQIKARKQTVLSGYDALQANQKGMQIGTRNTTDILNAQRQLYAAVRNYNNARYDYILNNLRLKQVSGMLTLDDLEQLSHYLLPNYQPDRDFLPPELVALQNTTFLHHQGK